MNRTVSIVGPEHENESQSSMSMRCGMERFSVPGPVKSRRNKGLHPEQRMGRDFRAVELAVAVGVLTVLVVGRPPRGSGAILVQPPTGPIVTAEQLVQTLSAGEPVDLEEATIEGDLDLRPVRVVKLPLRCQGCRFRASFNASDVVFERLIDLSESTVEGPLILRGAVFRDRAIFDSANLTDTVLGSVRFADNVSFSGANFLGKTQLERAHAGRSANFSRCSFSQDAIFSGAEFDGRANFTLANFGKKALFEEAELRGGGSFRVVTFRGEASFDRVSTARLLNFEGAVFYGDSSLRDIASSGSVSLIGITMAGGHLFIEQPAVEDFRMDVEAVKHVRGPIPQREILALIERSAEAREDLALANEARFRHLSLEAEMLEPIPRLLDTVFYRGIAGYLVRPSHPMLAFLLLLLAATVVRGVIELGKKMRGSWRRRRERTSNPHRKGFFHRPHYAVLAAEKAATILLRELAESFGTAFRRKPGIEMNKNDEDRVSFYFVAGALWVEFLIYKVLIGVFLVALGNSNATIRQLFDAVTKA